MVSRALAGAVPLAGNTAWLGPALSPWPFSMWHLPRLVSQVVPLLSCLDLSEMARPGDDRQTLFSFCVVVYTSV